MTLNSCKEKKDNTGQIFIPDILDNKLNLNLTDFFHSVEYIPLESTKATYLSRADGLIVDDDFVLVLDDDFDKLLQFNIDGRFVREFMKKGKGPNEFFEISSIDNNEADELLILRNTRSLDIMDYHGQVINTIKLHQTPLSAKWVSSEVIALFYPCPFYNANGGFEISFVDREGKILKNALKHKVERENKTGGRSMIGRNNGSLYYWYSHSDTVYTISNSLEVYPRYILTHDSRHIPVEKYSERDFQPNLNGQYIVESYFEWGDYIFITAVYNRHFFRGVVNKELNICGDVIANYDKWTYKGILNNYDGGAPFWPGRKLVDGSIVHVLDPMKLRETYEHNKTTNLNIVNNQQFEKLSLIIEDLTALSNPVLMIVK